jgi:putative phosphoesterase
MYQMKIGIISDTHDDIENVQEAIQIFNKNKADYVIHAGDYIFPGIIKEFMNLNAKLIGVLGNNDGEKNGILKSFIDLDGELKGELGEIEIDGLKFGIYHGTDNQLKENIIRSQKYNILICGHTHKREPQGSGIIENNERTFILNPGSAHRRSISISGSFDEIGRIILFDTQNKKYEFIDLTK